MLAARDPAERVELLISLTERLTGLLERETALFRARAPQKATEFQPEKSELAVIYRRESARIAQDRALIAGAPAPRRAVLADATRRFNAALEANRQAGEALRVLSEGMVRAVAEEVARRRAAPSYGPGATVGTAQPHGAAITLNQTV